MKNKILSAALVLGLGMVIQVSAQAVDFGAIGAGERTDLTLEQMMTYAIQDEYLARAEYELILEIYGPLRPFSNIVTAEERHIAWLTGLFAELDLSLPADTAAEHLLVPGGIEESLKTGIEAEIDNIDMYAGFLEHALPADVSDLFTRLMYASENHLRAFRNTLARYQ